MAELIWTIPALNDLEQLIEHPDSGSRPPELRQSRYRQIVEPPCRVFYRYDGERVFVLHVMRGEMRFRKSRLLKRDSKNRSV
jgi:plasmid stabilization system protein ParE